MILISGNMGYIGQVMTRFLTERSLEVVGLDSRFYRGCEFQNGTRPRFRQIVKDVRDVTEADLEGVTAVIHLAALSTDFLGEMDPQLTYDINGAASARLAEMAKKAGVERFLFSSSCSLYGISPEDRPITEEGLLNPITAYARAKAQAEVEIRKLADAHFHPVMLRNATVYGMSPGLRLDLVVNVMVAGAVLENKLTVFGDGHHWRPLVHVQDLCRAFYSVLHAPLETIHNQAFNVGVTGENYRVREIARIVKETLPGGNVEIQFVPGEGGRTYRVDCSKIHSACPDFQPQWDLRKGILELYEAYRKGGLTLRDLKSDKYFRVKRIRHLMDENVLNKDLRFLSRQFQEVG